MRIQLHRRSQGFSLLEVLIALVVLATGMLALAALQAKLASNSADAKARSRVAALLTSLFDAERGTGYANIATYGVTAASALPCNSGVLVAGIPLPDLICQAQADAGISGLTVAQAATTWCGKSGGGAFTQALCIPAPPKGGADYKLVRMTASWTDATGVTRRLSATNIASALNINGSNTFLDTPLTANTMIPQVHEQNPALTAGVIPIAVGANTDAASTNPLPTIDKALTSTTFTTLTYTQGGLDTSITRTIQKRVETTVAECACQFGYLSGGSPIVYTTGPDKGKVDPFLGSASYRPTYWDGTQYVSPVDALLTPYSAQHPDMVGAQNDLCTVVCRDHHDKDEISGVIHTGTIDPSDYNANYDSVTGDYSRYRIKVTPGGGSKPSTVLPVRDPVTGSLIPADGTGGSTDYIDAARLIRVDGLWRAATDIHAEHMGLLATTPKGIATSSAPDPSAGANYEAFVIDYMGVRLTQVLSGGSAPDGDALFDKHNLNDPATIIATTVPGEYRYLHGRGLYLDTLEQPAIDKLKNVASNCAPTDFPTCLLPYLPFNTINVTQLENWIALSKWIEQSKTTPPQMPPPPTGLPTPTGKIVVTNNTTSNNATQCSPGGKPPTIIRACVTGSSAGSDLAIASVGKSNSAVAASLPVSPYEENTANQFSDNQEFTIGTTNTDSEFFVTLGSNSTTLPNGTDLAFWTDDLSTTNDPTVQWLLGSVSDYCFGNVSRTDTNPNPYDCVTTLPLLTPLLVTVGNYNQVVQQQIANPCSGGTGTYSQPVMVCYAVKSVTVSGVTGYTASIVPPTTDVKTTAEQTTVTMSSLLPSIIPKGQATLNVTLVPNGTAAGSYTCDATTFVPTFTTPTACN